MLFSIYTCRSLVNFWRALVTFCARTCRSFCRSSAGTRAFWTFASTRFATCRLLVNQQSREIWGCGLPYRLEGDSGRDWLAASIVLSRILLVDFLTFLAVSVTADLASPSGETEPILHGQYDPENRVIALTPSSARIVP